MKTPRLLIFLTFAVLATGICDAGVKKEVKFARGASSSSIEGSVLRGERDLYYLGAQAGQVMEVSISSVEKNAVFAIYNPSPKVTSEEGMVYVKGESPVGATEVDDATQWQGVLPASGKYLIVVGGTRGNATYKLKVTIR